MRITCFFILFLSSWVIRAQEQRALIIGIDEYAPPANIKVGKNTSGRTEWPNLDGCRNDALVIKNAITIRWGFKNSHIRELYNAEATRKRILYEMNLLLNESKSGDIAFVYYAGHGSQVKNSRSKEIDKLDESIVPADAWQDGVDDIRDKTLAAIINRFIDKGILLTTIYDCCHSGSLGRGFNNDPPRFRYLKASNQDVMDPSDPAVPELRSEGKYLSISASQDNEPAQEQHDDNNIPHGAFTIALIKAMDQQSVDAPVNNLFRATRAILKSNGKKQEPVLSGSPGRLHGTLFGMKTGILDNKTLIPLISIADSLLEFQGGLMTGLNIDNELKKSGGDVTVKITIMKGANRCMGKIISGKIENIHPGEMFEVTNWISSSAAFLKLYIPKISSSPEDFERIKVVCRELKKSLAGKWCNDPEKRDADVNLYINNNRWFMIDAEGRPEMVPNFSAKSVNEIVKSRSVHINIPPPLPLYDQLIKTIINTKVISLTDDANDAQYFLSGTIDDNEQLSYSWVRCQTSAADSLEAMPVRTRFFRLPDNTRTITNDISDSLNFYALKIAKLRAWLNLQAPTVNDHFPFHLAVRNTTLNSGIEDGGIKIGNQLSVYLKGGENYRSNWDRKKRFVYVFIIDRNGNMDLIYPDENSGNVNNRFPILDEHDEPSAESKLVEGEVSEPVGSDTYFLLATEEPVPDYFNAFNQEGVRGAGNKNNPFYDLINLANPATRGLQKPITINWNLERTTVKTYR